MKKTIQLLATLICLALGANALHAATTYTWTADASGNYSIEIAS